jgi:hypothetical protein
MKLEGLLTLSIRIRVGNILNSKLINKMKKYSGMGLALSILMIILAGCDDDRALVQDAGFFTVEVADYNKMIADTIIVNVNEKLSFNFKDGNTDQILFYPGESGKEYRFAERSLYETSNGTKYESKVTVATAVNSFVSNIPTDFWLKAVRGMTACTADDFKSATKTDLLKLRATATSGTQVVDNFVLSATSVPVDINAGDLSLAIVAKSADATKNLLSVTVAGLTLTNTEVRDYGYSKNGVVVTNLKTVSYPVITNVVASAGWGQYAPEKTTAPGASSEVNNAAGYSWNVGETGVSFAPAVTGGAISANANGIIPASNYPLAVTVPADAAKVVSDGSAPSESWLLSRIVNTRTVKPDVATVVKRMDQSSLSGYQYIYSERGVYKASVVGVNVGTNGVQKVVREFIVLVKNPADNL